MPDPPQTIEENNNLVARPANKLPTNPDGLFTAFNPGSYYPGERYVDVIGQDLYWHGADFGKDTTEAAEAADRAFNQARYGVEVGTTPKTG